MKVSQEAVRKWFAGESQPKQPTMRKLAGALGVDYVCLALGTSHGEIEKGAQQRADRTQQFTRSRATLLSEATTCFGGSDADHDIDAIGHGVHCVIVVRSAEHQGRTKWTVRFPWLRWS